MTPNERPHPLTDAMLDANGLRCPCSEKPIELCIELEQMLAERTEERDKAQQDCESYCCTIDMLTDERDTALAKLTTANAAIFEAKFGEFGEHQLGVQLHSKLLEIERLNSELAAVTAERDALKSKLATINHIAMSLFVRTTSSEVTGEMAEIGRLSREDGQ